MTTWLSIVTTRHPNERVMQYFYDAVRQFSRERALAIELIIVSDRQFSDFKPVDYDFGDYIVTKKIDSKLDAGQVGSMIQGLIEARSDCVLSIDPDMYRSLSAVDEMADFLSQGYEAVVARRELKSRARWRAVSTYAFNILVSLALGFRVYDINSPMFMVNKRVIDHIASLPLPNEAYKLRLFIDYRYRLVEMPVRDISSKSGIPSTYRFDMLLSLFLKRLWLAVKLSRLSK